MKSIYPKFTNSKQPAIVILGCSFTDPVFYGYVKNNVNIWPNLFRDKLFPNCKIINLAKAGRSNDYAFKTLIRLLQNNRIKNKYRRRPGGCKHISTSNLYPDHTRTFCLVSLQAASSATALHSDESLRTIQAFIEVSQRCFRSQNTTTSALPRTAFSQQLKTAKSASAQRLGATPTLRKQTR